jgi:hypothetical protein
MYMIERFPKPYGAAEITVSGNLSSNEKVDKSAQKLGQSLW